MTGDVWMNDGGAVAHITRKSIEQAAQICTGVVERTGHRYRPQTLKTYSPTGQDFVECRCGYAAFIEVGPWVKYLADLGEEEE